MVIITKAVVKLTAMIRARPGLEIFDPTAVRSAAFGNGNIIQFFAIRASLMRRSAVLSLPFSLCSLPQTVPHGAMKIPTKGSKLGLSFDIFQD